MELRDEILLSLKQESIYVMDSIVIMLWKVGQANTDDFENFKIESEKKFNEIMRFRGIGTGSSFWVEYQKFYFEEKVRIYNDILETI